ncbi:MAG TPA: adenylate/guanylate cyclase domain-containing protein [Actinomycetota bacterium]|nr:adenylate/guanylate cyclase domain-containing protein [Actinomycetota bacterium]
MRKCPNCDTINSDAAKFCQGCGNPLPEKADAQEVRKICTMVFCDLTGSTALGESLDPETLRRIITRYFSEMKAILAKHGGTVEKFIGDAVMAAFGIPVIHEDDAVRGVRAAFEMQQAMAAMNVDLQLEYGKALYARIGVNTGEVIAGDSSEGHGFASGDTINVAARLEQAAEPGTVLLGEATYRLVRDSVEVESVEPLTLKGKSEPVPAYKLVDVLDPGEERIRRVDSPLVGRQKELTALRGAYERAREENGARLATVFGMAGSGKTRVAEEFVKALGDEVRVLEGRCLPYGEGITYWPIAEAIKQEAGITEEDTGQDALRKIDVLLPEGEERPLLAERIGSALGLIDATPSAQETFWAVRRLFEHFASERPLIVIFDDIQWAEPTMLDLIEYTASFSRGAPILVLCLSRRDLLDTRPTWGRATAGTTVILDPLTDDDVAALIDGALGHVSLPAEARKQIQSAAEGNPLYVEEIIKMLIDEGLLQQIDGRWKTSGDMSSLAIPPTIQTLVAARLDRLNSEEQAVVQRGSVVGKEFWWGAISELSNEELRPTLGHYLQSLVRKELIQPTQSLFFGEDAFRFGHIMIRDAAYQGMQKQLRADLHEAFAHWLETKVGDRLLEYEEILGYHLEHAYLFRQELGGTGDEIQDLGSRAAAILASAGQRALAKADAPAAANLLERAAKLLPLKDTTRLELSLQLTDALRELGEFKRGVEITEQTFRVSEAIGDRRLAGRARLQGCVLRGYSGLDGWKEEAEQQVAELLPLFEEVGDSLGQARAYHLMAEIHWDGYQIAASVETLMKSLTAARQADSKMDIQRTLGWLAEAAFWGPTPVADALRICKEVEEAGASDLLVQAHRLQSEAGLRAMIGEFDEARSLVAGSKKIQDELGRRLAHAINTQYAGIVELLANDAVAAERNFREGLEAFESMGERAYLATQAALLARSLYLQDRYDEAESFAQLSEEAGEGEEALVAEWGPTKARVLARRGDLEAAEELALQSVAYAQKGDDVVVSGYCLMGCAEILLLKGDVQGALGWIKQAHEVYEHKGIIVWSEKTAQLIDNFVTHSAG